jgi:hypothetical protein
MYKTNVAYGLAIDRRSFEGSWEDERRNDEAFTEIVIARKSVSWRTGCRGAEEE